MVGIASTRMLSTGEKLGPGATIWYSWLRLIHVLTDSVHDVTGAHIISPPAMISSEFWGQPITILHFWGITLWCHWEDCEARPRAVTFWRRSQEKVRFKWFVHVWCDWAPGLCVLRNSCTCKTLNSRVQGSQFWHAVCVVKHWTLDFRVPNSKIQVQMVYPCMVWLSSRYQCRNTVAHVKPWTLEFKVPSSDVQCLLWNTEL